MIETDRLIAPEATGPREDAMDRAIRPKTLKEYVGQPVVCDQMSIFLQAALGRDDSPEIENVGRLFSDEVQLTCG